MKIVFAYIVCKNKMEAKRIGTAIVKEKLCACVNIFPEMHSIYFWKGKLEKSNECVLIAKTERRMFKKLTARVKILHSYDCPCILQLKVKEGNKEYVKWLLENIDSKNQD